MSTNLSNNKEKIRVGMVSLGCPKNLVDAETMLGILDKSGYEITPTPQDAHVLIVNTCGFIDKAKQESIDSILEMAEYKKDRCRLLIVTGCLAQRYRQDILDEIPEVDVVVEVGRHVDIAGIIERYAQHSSKSYKYQQIPGDVIPRMLSTPHYTAYLKIADGCNNNCSYCVIPQIRGRYKSRPAEDIINEAVNLSKLGVRELIVVAQDTTKYGIDLYGSKGLPELLSRLCKIDGVEWIRLHYCYPEDIDNNLLQTFVDNNKLCNYFDIPMQHCNDKILSKMGRKSDKKQLTDLIDKIRTKIPDAVIRTSLIVGFPGETRQEFEELKEFVQHSKLDRIGVFEYSREDGTKAADFPEQLDDNIKKRRAEILMEIQNRISRRKNKDKIGNVYKVLVEGFEDIFYYGRTYADSISIDGKVYFASGRDLSAGEFVDVKILDADDYDLTGEMI